MTCCRDLVRLGAFALCVAAAGALTLEACGEPPVYSRGGTGGFLIAVMNGGGAGVGGSSSKPGGASGSSGGSGGSGGRSSQGGGASGGGGRVNGGTGGMFASGGAASLSGSVTGGSAQGGRGGATGGTTTGGSATGGSATGGSATGGRSTGGAAGSSPAQATGGSVNSSDAGSLGGSGQEAGPIETGGVGGDAGVSFGGAGGQGGASLGGTTNPEGGSGGAITPDNSDVPASIDCSLPTVPTLGLLSDFTDVAGIARVVASTGLLATVYAYHGGTTSTATATLDAATQDLHCVSSAAPGGYNGCGIVFDTCQSVGSFKKLRFSISGTTNCHLELQVQMYSQRTITQVPAGGCSTTDGGSCLNYGKSQFDSISPGVVTVALSSLSSWPTAAGNELVGVQWQLTNTGNANCTADFRVDDVRLVQ